MSENRTPLWVKVSGAIALVVVLAVVGMLVVGGTGGHGPGRHGGGDDRPERHTPPPGVDTSRGHTPPPGVEHRPPQP